MTSDARDGDAVWRELIAHYGAPAGPDGGPTPWPEREDLRPDGPSGQPGGDNGTGPAPADPPPAAGTGPLPGVMPAPPQPRIIRPAGPAPLPSAPDDEHFVPPPPPPLPRLDPLTKGAWAALFGGPGYLLLAVLVGWQVPGWAAMCAVAAFVGGFTTLVVKMGDRPPTDSGPGDGAVV